MVKKKIKVISTSQEIIQSMIYIVRGQKIMLDEDLAQLYGVTTSRLNEQVKRNVKRFPDDFMFQLSKDEFQVLKSQFATSSWGGRRKLPFAFTEQGVAMLSSVLNSDRAIRVNITIMRTFTQLRQLTFIHKELASQLKKIENRIGKHDGDIRAIIDLIRKLHSEPEKQKKEIGFHVES
ncbi:MAG: ORF6N domain-containing protein [Candidatus Omnitrophica bacterium]|nr:ORF6N domain-containing protein [Candidatus Omnitrophota bacterium]